MHSIVLPFLKFARSPVTARKLLRQHKRAVITRHGQPFLIAHPSAEDRAIGLTIGADALNDRRSGVVAEIEAGRCVRVTWRGEGVMDLVPVEVP